MLQLQNHVAGTARLQEGALNRRAGIRAFLRPASQRSASALACSPRAEELWNDSLTSLQPLTGSCTGEESIEKHERQTGIGSHVCRGCAVLLRGLLELIEAYGPEHVVLRSKYSCARGANSHIIVKCLRALGPGSEMQCDQDSRPRFRNVCRVNASIPISKA